MMRLLHRARSAAAGLFQRAALTVRYAGWGSLALRVLTLPLRLTPLGRRLPWGRHLRAPQRVARAWYRRHWRPVTVVIPTYGPPDETLRTVESVRRTTDRRRVRIVVADDGSEPEHQRRLAQGRGFEAVLGEGNAGFAANVNRGLRAARPGDDVVVLNSDVRAQEGWLEVLQHAAYSERAGVAGAKLLYPDGRIQWAGSHRNLGAPEWFDHRYRFAPGDHAPANVPVDVIAVTGACMYVQRALLDEVGLLDEAYGMAFEDVDFCLRAWEAGSRCRYAPAAELAHLESATRGMVQGERELASQRLFWERWGQWFDGREVRGPDGRLRIIYVTQDTGIGGGHRVVFEHLNRLARRGHAAELYTLGGGPDWFELEVPVRGFAHYRELAAELAEQDAVKVATWWNTSPWVWYASVRRGLPVYFVQDIETSYYEGQPYWQNEVLATYRHEFRYLTTSGWNHDRLAELGFESRPVAPGVALETFRPLEVKRRDDVLLAVGRGNPLKNVELTLAAWEALPAPRPRLWLFGVEPEVGREQADRYVLAPSDEEVNRLYNEATVFVQTSRHEGFCLPLLEAMAAGVPVVCTDADGNRDFCRDGVNCLLVEDTPEAVAAAIARLFADPELRRRLAEEGRRTAERHAWEPLVDELERFYESLSTTPGAFRAAPARQLSA